MVAEMEAMEDKIEATAPKIESLMIRYNTREDAKRFQKGNKETGHILGTRNQNGNSRG